MGELREAQDRLEKKRAELKAMSSHIPTIPVERTEIAPEGKVTKEQLQK